MDDREANEWCQIRPQPALTVDSSRSVFRGSTSILTGCSRKGMRSMNNLPAGFNTTSRLPFAVEIVIWTGSTNALPGCV